MQHISNSLLKIDIFGEPVPSFNLSGRQVIKTHSGALISIVIFSLTLVYGLIKMQQLFERKNPVINTNVTPVAVGASYNVLQDEFYAAFAAENYET